MSDDLAQTWLGYAQENLQTARLAAASRLLHPALQNAQQAIEKALKAVWVARGKVVRKTHCIADLVEDLAGIGIDAELSEADCDFLDSIYLPSKYPVTSAIPDGMPTLATAERCIRLADQVCAGRRANLRRGRVEIYCGADAKMFNDLFTLRWSP